MTSRTLDCWRGCGGEANLLCLDSLDSAAGAPATTNLPQFQIARDDLRLGRALQHQPVVSCRSGWAAPLDEAKRVFPDAMKNYDAMLLASCSDPYETKETKSKSATIIF